MNQMKRLINGNQLTNHELKRFRTSIEEEKSVTCIENFSNELFYEIFDYLDGCEIFDAFSNLNTRFREFLNSSSFLLKIHRFSTRERTFKRYCKQVIIPNKHKILSLNLYDQTLISLFCTLCNIDLSFNRLESLVLNGIKLDQLLLLLNNMMDLPRLFSLNIRLIGDYEDLDYIYELILYLPSLKNIKISVALDKRIDLLPTALRNQTSTIEHLNINHECTLYGLSAILSHTLNLRRLTCQQLFDVGDAFSSTLPSLTHISVNDCDFSFDKFEIVIKQICSKLQVMRFINRSNDPAYLDGNRWERLILQYMPDLSVFYFQFSENLSTSHSFTSYHTRMKQFTASFWIKRRWIFALEINRSRIIYSIDSYRKRWCDFHDISPDQQDTKDLSMQFCQAIQLTVSGFFGDDDQDIFDKIKHISSWIQMTRLNIDCSRISIKTFIKLICLLSNSDSLIVVPIPVQQIHSLTGTQIETFRLEANNNKITKMNIGLITEIAQVMFFVDLFPHIIYLEVNCANDINLEVLMECILTKTASCIIPQLCSVCLCVGQISDEIIEKLHKLMAVQNFIHDYTIKHVYDRIYLRWK